MYEDDEVYYLRSVISLDDLCKRWSSNKDDLHLLLYKYDVVVFELKQVKQDPVTKEKVYISIVTNSFNFLNVKNPVFDMNHVLYAEQREPSLAWQESEYSENDIHNNTSVEKKNNDKEKLLPCPIDEWLETYPVCKMIRDLHLAGKSRDEIRLTLLDIGYSNAQTAFLTQEDTNIRTDNAQKQAMKRLKNASGT